MSLETGHVVSQRHVLCAMVSWNPQCGNGSICTCRQGPPALLAFLEPAKTVHAVMKVYQGHCKGACERLLASTARRLALRPACCPPQRNRVTHT